MFDRLKKFGGKYRLIGIPLIILGILGLLLPLLPGIILIGFGLYILFPGRVEKLWTKIRQQR